MTHGNKRQGNTTLFAAPEVGTGLVIHEGLLRPRHQEFLLNKGLKTRYADSISYLTPRKVSRSFPGASRPANRAAGKCRY
jgi:hypothetical protein